MNEESASAVARPFRFSLRWLLLVVTGICVLAGAFWFVSLVLLLLAGVLAVQCVFFLIIQRLVNLVAGSPEPDDAGDDSRPNAP
jgi:hypothetical protein